jgi:hypothetical protein
MEDGRNTHRILFWKLKGKMLRELYGISGRAILKLILQKLDGKVEAALIWLWQTNVNTGIKLWVSFFEYLRTY